MSELIPFCNDWAVGLFGSVLAAYFCSALTTRRNKWRSEEHTSELQSRI